jgi:hypothetical protein
MLFKFRLVQYSKSNKYFLLPELYNLEYKIALFLLTG